MPETQPCEATADAPRSWDMHAGRHTLHSGEDEFIDFGDPWYVQAHGHDIVHPVRLVEDPDGDYTGWIDTGQTAPVMIYRREIFPVCFPHGVASAVDKGHGAPVSLRPEPRDED